MGSITGPTGWTVRWRELGRWVPGDVVAATLYADARPSFWLDSSRSAYGGGRFSFLGDTSGSGSEVLTYRAGSGAVSVDRGVVDVEPGTIFEVLYRRLRERSLVPESGMDLPFDFVGGYVGYFGYELRADCGYDAGRHVAPTPDAVWLFADRFVALDHDRHRTYVVAVSDAHDGSGERWLAQTEDALLTAPAAAQDAVSNPPVSPARLTEAMSRGPERYLRDVETCLEHLRRGESYEICLTDNLHLPFAGDDLRSYLALRLANPAPYSALLRLDGFTVFSTSPERFLTIERDGRVQSKPIKGTSARHRDPADDARSAATLREDPKARAENVMIVDLLRNDLGQVCRTGSVYVEPLMALESYESVHQLVSTVHGRLRPGITAVECARRCFPGGSVTGAPKARTLELIDAIEDEPRGVYTGAIGAFGLAGTADLNIVIRSAVRIGDELTVGAGGAIVLDSDPVAELDELLLKAAAPVQGLGVEKVDPLVIDSFRVVDGAVRRLDLHADRFATACARVAEIAPERAREFVETATRSIPDVGDWFPRVELTAAGRLHLLVRPSPATSAGITAWLAGPSRCSAPQVKGADLAYLRRVRAEATGHGADEAVLTDDDGRLLEGTTTALMWWAGDQLCAVDSVDVLASVTRQVLVDLAAIDGVQVRLTRPRPGELDGCEAWLVNALHGIRHVAAWVGAGIRPGPATRRDAWQHRLDALRTVEAVKYSTS